MDDTNIKQHMFFCVIAQQLAGLERALAQLDLPLQQANREPDQKRTQQALTATSSPQTSPDR